LGNPRIDKADLTDPLPDDVDDSVRDAVVKRPPLWYYVLCEAKAQNAGGLQLGQTGGRIVAEVINGLLAADPNSYVNVKEGFTPTLPSAEKNKFTMADLVTFTEGPPPG
jgi:hypothetical protein